MGRRSYIRKLSAFGVTPTAAATLSKDDLESLVGDVEDEVPRLAYLRHKNHQELQSAAKNGEPHDVELEPIHYRIPRERWVTNIAPFVAIPEVRRTLPTTARNIEVRVSSNVTNHRHDRGIEIAVLDDDGSCSTKPMSYNEVARRAPNSTSTTVEYGDKQTEVSAIPVEVTREQRDYAGHNSANHYTTNYQPNVPGGCLITNKDTGEYMTLTTPATDLSDNRSLWLSCGHLGNTDAKVGQPHPDVLGKITASIDNTAISSSHYEGTDCQGDDWDNSGPADFCKIEDGYGFDEEDESGWWWIANNSGGVSYPIVGTVRWDRIVDGLDTGYSLWRQGVMSGRDIGDVDCIGVGTTDTDGDGDPEYPRWFRTTASIVKGDSGGPTSRCIMGRHT